MNPIGTFVFGIIVATAAWMFWNFWNRTPEMSVIEVDPLKTLCIDYVSNSWRYADAIYNRSQIEEILAQAKPDGTIWTILKWIFYIFGYGIVILIVALFILFVISNRVDDLKSFGLVILIIGAFVVACFDFMMMLFGRKKENTYYGQLFDGLEKLLGKKST